MESLGPAMGQFLPLILIFGVFYFLLIRPQQKRVKEQKEMLSALSRGDRIVTNGGLMGTITKVVNDAELEVEFADGVKVRVLRSMIASTISGSKTTTTTPTTETTTSTTTSLKVVTPTKTTVKKPVAKTTAKKTTTKTAKKA